MIVVDGKVVLTELNELVDPRGTALLLVDMQRDFVEPDGTFGALGADLSMYKAVRSNLVELLAAARRVGVLVVHVQNSALPDRMSDSPAQIRFNLRMHAAARGEGPPLRYSLPGTPGHAFVAGLTPQPGELVVTKYRSSAFWGTNLEMLLRSNDIRGVIIGGCTTEGCVESTARDALFSDHYVVVAEDGVGSDDPAQHEASMLLMRHRFDLATCSEVTDVWQRVPPSSQRAGRRSAPPQDL